MTRRQAAQACTAALAVWGLDAKSEAGDRVQLVRVPETGIQPQVTVDDHGVLHLVYYTGDSGNGDLFYTRSSDGGKTFSRALQVNSQSESAISAGTIRGAQVAVGNADRVHVAWNGSDKAHPQGPVNPDSGTPGAPMVYTRLNDARDAFEPQRNLMHHSFGLDGGGSVAADRSGNVYVAWHAIGELDASGKGAEGEARRQVWLTKSSDEGRSFEAEKKALSQPTGACGCCGMKVFAGRQGNVSMLYRSATDSVHRDIYVLVSNDHGRRFQGTLLHPWEINACPMSSMDLAENDKMLIGAWETAGQVYWARLDRGGALAGQPIGAPGQAKGRKHPRMAVNRDGELLLVWTEGTGWKKGGSLAWQLYDRSGRPAGEMRQLAGIPTWSFAAAAAAADNGRFSLIF